MLPKIIACLPLLLSTLCAAQEIDSVEFNKKKNRREQNYLFLQQTLNYSPLSYASPPFFDLGSPKNWYVLSGDIIPQFVIGGDKLPFAIHITPRYMVRMFHNNKVQGDSSLPVRTPSYMPGATIYFRNGRADDSVRKIFYTSLSVFHHSNGQDGREFVNGKINTYNGNFSTNYIEPAFHFRIRNKFVNVFKNTKSYQPQDYFNFYVRIGYEHHFYTVQALKSSYGNERINLTLGFIEVLRRLHRYYKNSFYKERNRLVFNTTFIAGARDQGLGVFQKRINFNLNYYWRIPSSPNTALMLAGGYYGSDPYNIYYMQSYWFVRAGLAFGFFISPNKNRNLDN